MATATQKKRIVKYLSRDFDSFKRDLIEHLRIYFPDTVQDYNESSVGILLTELMAFVGDNMSFYLDKKFNESFIDTANERKNIFKHAKQLGFKAFGKSSATGTVDVFVKVPAIRQREEIIPDMRYAGKIKKGAKFKSSSGQTYETIDEIDFSKVDISREEFVQVGDRNTQTNEASNFVLRKANVDVKAGETVTTTFTIGAYESFKKLTINQEDVFEVVEIKDSEGNIWYEVDFLAQDTVFYGVSNTSADVTDVPYVLKLKSVPYRFITEFDIDTKKMSIQFGSGDAQNFDGDLIPDLGDLSLPLFGRDTFTDFFLDPQNFLKTRTLGLAPVNTVLTVKYRVGGGSSTNAGSGEITTVSESIFEVADSSLSTNVISDIGNSVSVYNFGPIQGGRDELSLEEIRQLISANFASQGRMVTAEDFVVRALSMPAKYGSVFRVNANASQLNRNAVELTVLSKNSNNFVTVAPADLKKNLKTYLSRFRMLTDAIEILDGEVVNIGVNFSILSSPDFNRSEILVNCIESLKEHFNINLWQINQPINLTTITSILSQIAGVLSVINISIVNKVGTVNSLSYSSTVYNIQSNTRNGIVYCDNNKIFEIKYPNKDIIGVVK